MQIFVCCQERQLRWTVAATDSFPSQQSHASTMCCLSQRASSLVSRAGEWRRSGKLAHKWGFQTFLGRRGTLIWTLVRTSKSSDWSALPSDFHCSVFYLCKTTIATIKFCAWCAQKKRKLAACCDWQQQESSHFTHRVIRAALQLKVILKNSGVRKTFA